MDSSQHTFIVNFIWNIADDILRDVYVRGKYRDVILPMTVIRRLDAVLEPTKHAVLAMKPHLDAAGMVNQGAALCAAAGQAFYNTSRFELHRIGKTCCKHTAHEHGCHQGPRFTGVRVNGWTWTRSASAPLSQGVPRVSRPLGSASL